MTSCNKTGFVAPIVLDCIRHINSDLLVDRTGVTSAAEVFKGGKLIDHDNLCVSALANLALPLHLSIAIACS